MAKWPNLKIIRVSVPPEVLYNHMWAVMNAYNRVDFEFPVAIRASLPSATTCLERPYLLGPLGGRYIQVLLYIISEVSVSIKIMQGKHFWHSLISQLISAKTNTYQVFMYLNSSTRNIQTTIYLIIIIISLRMKANGHTIPHVYSLLTSIKVQFPLWPQHSHDQFLNGTPRIQCLGNLATILWIINTQISHEYSVN